jgi:hypothetical protein
MKTSIYSLHDENGNLRNIGMTTKSLEERLKGHLKEAQKGGKNHRCCWIRSMLKRGFAPTIELITEVQEINGAKAEIAYIAYYRKKGFNLVNSTRGGDGLVNPTKEVRQRMSESHKGQITWNKGRTDLPKQSAVTKRKRSASLKRGYQNGRVAWNKDKKTPEETKVKQRKQVPWNKDMIVSEDHRLVLSTSHLGQVPWNKGLHDYLPEDSIKKMRESHLGQIPDNKGKHPSAAVREKQSVAQLLRFANARRNKL